MYTFDDCSKPAEVKQKMARLAFRHHPNHGGDNDTMRQILEAYHERLEELDRYTETGSDGKEHTYYYNETRENAQLNAAIRAALVVKGIATVELVGTWVWVTFHNKPDKPTRETFKAIFDDVGKFHWNRKRGTWQWKPAGSRSRASSLDNDTLKAVHGSERVAVAQPAALAS